MLMLKQAIPVVVGQQQKLAYYSSHGSADKSSYATDATTSKPIRIYRYDLIVIHGVRRNADDNHCSTNDLLKYKLLAIR